MLIDTNQIIPKTDLRMRLSEIIEAAAEGKTFYVSERGKIKVKITVAEENSKTDKLKLLDEIRKIREENDRRFRKSKRKIWSSEELVRKMRDDRTKHLMKFLK